MLTQEDTDHVSTSQLSLATNYLGYLEIPFFLAADGLTSGKRDEMVQALFGRNEESSTDG